MQILTRPWMVIVFLLALPAFAFALDINEEIRNVRLLAIYPGNVVVLSRGLEDGIMVGSHAKLRASEGFAARALCVKSGMLTSHWRLYRIVESQLVSKDLTYTLIGMDSSESPARVEEWQKIDHDKIVPVFDEKKLLPPEKAVSEVKGDLPDALDKDDTIDAKKTGATQFVERNYDPDRLRRDFEKINGSIYASPWSVQKGGNTDIENVRYGAKLSNEGRKYVFGAAIDRRVMRAKETTTGEKVINEGTDANVRFTVKELTTSWDAYSDLTYRQARYGKYSTPKSHYLFSPIGFTRHFSEGKYLKKSFLSYSPTYDSRTHEGLDENGNETLLKESGLRHSLRLYLMWQFTNDFSVSSDLNYRPMQNMSSWRIDAGDNLAQERLVASIRLVGSLFIDYEFNWLDDAQLKRLNHIPRVVTTNSLNVRYDF